MESGAEFEALVRIYWDREEQKFIPFVPKQRVTKDRVTVRLADETLPDDTRYSASIGKTFCRHSNIC